MKRTIFSIVIGRLLAPLPARAQQPLPLHEVRTIYVAQKMEAAKKDGKAGALVTLKVRDDFLQCLRRRLQEWDQLQIVPQEDEADAVLGCNAHATVFLKVSQDRREDARYVRTTAAAWLVDRHTKKTIWSSAKGEWSMVPQANLGRPIPTKHITETDRQIYAQQLDQLADKIIRQLEKDWEKSAKKRSKLRAMSGATGWVFPFYISLRRVTLTRRAMSAPIQSDGSA